MDRVFLLSVPIDAVTPAEAVSRIREMLAGSRQCHVTTPNNEMLVEAAANPAFLNVLNASALNLPDSTGLLFAARWTSQRLPCRSTGVDTVTHLCAALDERQSVFFLGAAPGVARRAADALQEQNSRLAVAGTYAGTPGDDEASAIVELINRSGASLLLVAYGAPAQDLWIAKHLASMPSVRVAMGVGGTFDFLAGTVKRAPRALRALGCEWLWRLMLQPSRFPRIIRATVQFPLLVLRHGRFLRGDPRRS